MQETAYKHVCHITSRSRGIHARAKDAYSYKLIKSSKVSLFLQLASHTHKQIPKRTYVLSNNLCLSGHEWAQNERPKEWSWTGGYNNNRERARAFNTYEK